MIGNKINEGTFKYPLSYYPKVGDIFFTGSDYTSNSGKHTGIIISVNRQNNTFTAICGNSSDKVQIEYHSLSESDLLGYFSPLYTNNHNATSSWYKDTNTHWHVCTYCGIVLNEAVHTWVNYGSYLMCSVCGKTVSQGGGIEAIYPVTQ